MRVVVATGELDRGSHETCEPRRREAKEAVWVEDSWRVDKLASKQRAQASLSRMRKMSWKTETGEGERKEQQSKTRPRARIEELRQKTVERRQLGSENAIRSKISTK